MVIPQRPFPRQFSIAHQSGQYCSSSLWREKLLCGPGATTEGSAGRLIVQDHAEEAAIDRQRAAGVVDKAEPLKLIHEMTHS